MAVWTSATGTYFAFRDNILTRLIGRQTEMQFAYEDRIAELRAQVDRIMSRQLLDQEQFEKKLNTLCSGKPLWSSARRPLAAIPPPPALSSLPASRHRLRCPRRGRSARRRSTTP